MLLTTLLPHSARLHPDRIAMKHEHLSLSYSELWHQVSCVAQGLLDLEIEPGERIVLLGDPCPYLAIAECAAVAVGAVPVAIFPGLAATELQQIVDDAAPSALIVDYRQPKLADCKPALRTAITIAFEARHAPLSLEGWIASCAPLVRWHTAQPDDVALIIYTGGTTGRPKGVMHSHRTIRLWANMNPDRGGGHNPSRKSLVPNQAHLTGQYILWNTLFEGGCLIYASSYPLQAEEVVRIIETEQIQYLGTVGLLLRDMVNLDRIHSRQLDSLKGISCGGAPISERTLRKASEVFPHARITEVYSQTESGQFISFLPVDFADEKRHRLRSVGNPAHMAEWGQEPFDVRIVDDEGNDVAPGAIGEIICRSSQIMLGYWNQPEATSSTLREGWLYTGDLRQDEDGYLYLLDRKKDMVIVGGSNVYCSEVEAILERHPAVAEAAVLAMPLPVEGEEVAAVVVLREGESLSLGELQQFCIPYLASFKHPTRLETASRLERTTAGKLNKRAIRQLLTIDTSH